MLIVPCFQLVLSPLGAFVTWWFVIFFPPRKGSYVAKNALRDKIRRDKTPSERSPQPALRESGTIIRNGRWPTRHVGLLGHLRQSLRSRQRITQLPTPPTQAVGGHGGLAKQRGSAMKRAKIARRSNSEVKHLEHLGQFAKCRQRVRLPPLSSFIRAGRSARRNRRHPMFPAPPSWPVRTRTLNDRVRICSVTNYTTGH
jgi:hypothetical protein